MLTVPYLSGIPDERERQMTGMDPFRSVTHREYKKRLKDRNGSEVAIFKVLAVTTTGVAQWQSYLKATQITEVAYTKQQHLADDE